MRVAIAQTDIVWEKKDTNFANCEKFLIRAKDFDVDFVLFPEMTLTGFTMNINVCGDSNNETIDMFFNLARKYNINIGFGYIEKLENGFGKNHYACVSPQKILGDYVKIHPFSFGAESKYYEGGDFPILFELGGFNVAPFVCYDLRFPEIFQAVSNTANIITIAANWPTSRISHWEILLQARAIENQCYVFGSNRVGKDGQNTYCGNSLIIGPDGKILSRADDKEKLLFHDVNFEYVNEIRTRFPLKKDRKNKLYADMLMQNDK
jgi:predicted amidohydrolase